MTGRWIRWLVVALSIVLVSQTAAAQRAPGPPGPQRREMLEHLLEQASPPLHLTPMTRDRSTAVRWLREFEGAGLDATQTDYTRVLARALELNGGLWAKQLDVVLGATESEAVR